MNELTSQRVVAVVVAFNRVDLLSKVLDALQNQTRPIDTILVVDNHSSDGTGLMVAARYPSVLYFDTGYNSGGAGGFAWGIELATAMGFDLAWVMDDDAIPEPSALEELFLGQNVFNPTTGMAFVASIPVASDLSSEKTAGKPLPSDDYERQRAARDLGAIAISCASFLGLLINLGRVQQDELPNPDFFIWCDDVEYTTRVASKYGAVCAPLSLIVHESPAMQNALVRAPLGWKYFYQVRNNIWLARWGLIGSSGSQRLTHLIFAVKVSRIELLHGEAKIRIVLTTFRAWSSGLFARRRHYPVGSLLLSSPHAQSWVEHAAVTFR